MKAKLMAHEIRCNRFFSYPRRAWQSLSQWRSVPSYRARLAWSEAPAVVYAIGDVHGCMKLLKGLEAKIAEDAGRRAGKKVIVMLGDYVDRGPDSAEVIDHLLSAPPDGFQRICLAGNHDQLMQRCLMDSTGLDRWRSVGGDETLRSYGMDKVTLSALHSGTAYTRRAIMKAYIPQAHLDFLDSLPVSLTFPGYVFVHGGLREGVPLPQHTDGELQTIRLLFSEADDRDRGFVVVHGHTPIKQPKIFTSRIALDLNAPVSGQLCAVRIVPGEVATPLIERLTTSYVGSSNQKKSDLQCNFGGAAHG